MSCTNIEERTLCTRSALREGHVRYITEGFSSNVICHFPPTVDCACVRSGERDTLIRYTNRQEVTDVIVRQYENTEFDVKKGKIFPLQARCGPEGG